MSNRANEQYSIYTIPYNFIDESKVFGGLISTRKLIEGAVLGAIASTPFFLISFPLKIKLTLILVCFLIFGVIGCVGINGDPITKFIVYYIKFRKQKRVVVFNGKVKFHESAAENIEFAELPRDRVLKLFAGMSSSRKAAEGTVMDDEADEFVFDDDIIEDSDHRMDIISKLLGKKNTVIYDSTYDAAMDSSILQDELYGDADDFDVDMDESEDDSDSVQIAFAEYSDYTEDESEIEFMLDESEVERNPDGILSDKIEYADTGDDVPDEYCDVPLLSLEEADLIEVGIDMSAMDDDETAYVDVGDVMKGVMGSDEWQCKVCMTINDGKFCQECGASRE